MIPNDAKTQRTSSIKKQRRSIPVDQDLFNSQIKTVSDENKFISNEDYLISTFGLLIGFGSLWRLPSLSYLNNIQVQQNGGQAFLYAYSLCIFLITIPCYYFDTVLGQIYQISPIKLFSGYGERFKGLGLFTIIIAIIRQSFYNVFLSFSYIYFFLSFIDPLPWSEETGENINEKAFFNKKILKLSDDISQIGEYNWALSLVQILSYIIVYFCIRNGVKQSAIIAKYSIISIFIFLIVLCIKGNSLPGSLDGQNYLFQNDFSKLGTLKIWIDSFTQAILQFSIGPGILMLYGSYRQKSQSLDQSTIYVPGVVFIWGIFSSIFIFQILGFLSYELEIPISQIKEDGVELIFIVLPMAFSEMELSNLWAIIFFFLMINLGLNIIMAYIECISIIFEQTNYFKQQNINKQQLRAKICFFLALFGQIFCFGNGYYLTTLFYDFLTLTIFISSIIKPLFICYNNEYFNHLQIQVKRITKLNFDTYVKYCLKFVTIPLLIIFTSYQIFQLSDKYKNLQFGWKFFGWYVIVCGPIFGALYTYFANRKNDQTNTICIDEKDNLNNYGTFNKIQF